MDLIIVDVTDVPETRSKRGDTVTLIGDDLTIDEVGRRAGTIGYEILTSLGARYARAYRGGASLMAKRQPTFVCQSCGAVYNRWKGKCEACGGWNTIVEETGAASPMAGPVATRPSRAKGRIFPLEGLSGETKEAPRTPSGIAELDRVTGGGFVHGSVILLGGDPGIGKSTLLMQASAALANQGHRVAYISGEEAVAQVRLRAERLGLGQAPVELASETNVEDIIATLSQGRPPALAIIDSIQTMWTETVESAPGTVTQVRGSAQALIRFAKTTGTAVILVGHVTKDGQIAGPRVVEHMVDAVVSFEGDTGHHFRILRAVKNRFGPTDEIGVFEMSDQGLREVPNPSELFLAGRDLATAGHRRLRRHGGHAPAARRDPGPRRADLPRHAAPRRGRLGPEPPLHGARGARGPWRPEARHARRLSQRRRRPAHHRARRRPRRRRGPGLVPVRQRPAAGHGLFRRDRPVRRDPPGGPGAGPPEGGGEARLLQRRLASAAARQAKGSKSERLPLATSAIGHITDLVANIAVRRRKAS